MGNLFHFLLLIPVTGELEDSFVGRRLPEVRMTGLLSQLLTRVNTLFKSILILQEYIHPSRLHSFIRSTIIYQENTRYQEYTPLVDPPIKSAHSYQKCTHLSRVHSIILSTLTYLEYTHISIVQSPIMSALTYQ